MDFVETPGGPPQEVMMWRSFSQFARAVDAAKDSGDDAESPNDHWGSNTHSKVAYEISSVSLETQRIIQALMESLRANGSQIKMSPTNPELLRKGLYLSGQM